ncbi:MAG TPA: TetR/AcrR family transcriptional regulator [Streptosporangiaceae bacterium]
MTSSTSTTGTAASGAGPTQGAGTPAGGPPLRADARRNRERLLAAATAAFAEHGADAPLEDIARRAGVGIGTLYRHFPTRLALQEGVFRSQVDAVCQRGRDLAGSPAPGDAFADWLQALSGYLATKRGLSQALIATLGRDSELISSCSQLMKTTAEQLLLRAQEAGQLRADISAMDVMRLVHGIAVATERAPGDAPRLLSLMIDGLRPPAG